MDFDASVVDNYYYYNKQYNKFLSSTFNENKTCNDTEYYRTWPNSYLPVKYEYKQGDIEEVLNVMIDLKSLRKHTLGYGSQRCGGLKCRNWSDGLPIKGNWCTSCFGDEPDRLFEGLMNWYDCTTLKQLLNTGVTIWINYDDDHKLFFDCIYPDYNHGEYTKKENKNGSYYYSFDG